MTAFYSLLQSQFRLGSSVLLMKMRIDLATINGESGELKDRMACQTLLLCYGCVKDCSPLKMNAKN